MSKMTLKAARINRNLTAKEAAEKLGISVETLSNWEKGETYPDIPKLKRIETVYQVGYNDLIFLM